MHSPPGAIQSQGLTTAVYKEMFSFFSHRSWASPSVHYLEPFPELGDAAGRLLVSPLPTRTLSVPESSRQTKLCFRWRLRLPTLYFIGPHRADNTLSGESSARSKGLFPRQSESDAQVATRILQLRQLPREHIF